MRGGKDNSATACELTGQFGNSRHFAAWRIEGCHSLPAPALMDDAVDIVPFAVPAGELLDHVASNLTRPAGRTCPRRPPFSDLVGLVVGVRR